MQGVSRADVMVRVTSIVSDILGVSGLRLTDETTARDVQGWDSLTHVQIIIAVESEYGFRFSFSEASQLENVGQFVDAIYAKTRSS